MMITVWQINALLHNSIYLVRIGLFNNCVHWPSYNQSLVKRGEILFAYDFLDMWDDNLDRMNENKKANHILFLILSSYLSNISEYTFTYLKTNRRNH